MAMIFCKFYQAAKLTIEFRNFFEFWSGIWFSVRFPVFFTSDGRIEENFMPENFLRHIGSFATKILLLVRRPVYCPVSGFILFRDFFCEVIVLKRIFRIVILKNSSKIRDVFISMNHSTLHREVYLIPSPFHGPFEEGV